MICQNTELENTRNKFSDAINQLKLGKLLRKSNITKNCGVSAYEIFQFLLLLVFQGKNLFRFLNSKHKDQAVSKNTYYSFLNETSFNWKKFMLLLAVKVTAAFDKLSRPERVNVLALDDSVIKRNRNKKSECLYLLSTDCSLPDSEIVRIYGNRWSIKCFSRHQNHS